MMVEGVVQVDRSNEAENLLALGYRDYEMRNFHLAHMRATKVLEINANSVGAWRLRGKAAGWLSTRGGPRHTGNDGLLQLRT